MSFKDKWKEINEWAKNWATLPILLLLGIAVLIFIFQYGTRVYDVSARLAKVESYATKSEGQAENLKKFFQNMDDAKQVRIREVVNLIAERLEDKTDSKKIVDQIIANKIEMVTLPVVIEKGTVTNRIAKREDNNYDIKVEGGNKETWIYISDMTPTNSKKKIIAAWFAPCDTMLLTFYHQPIFRLNEPENGTLKLMLKLHEAPDPSKTPFHVNAFLHIVYQ